MDIEALKRVALERGAERGRLLAERCAKSVLPLFTADDRSRPDRLGSCVLFQMGPGRHFAFTASHVMSNRGDSILYIGSGPRGRVIQIPSGIAYRTAGDDDDSADVAILPLRTSHLKAHSSQWNFLTQDDVEETAQSAVEEQHPHFVFGYPTSNSQVRVIPSERHVRQNSFQLTTFPEQPATYQRERLDARINLVLEFDHKDTRVRGEKVVPPKLEGVSGGAVFKLWSLEIDPIAKLVAIATEHRKSSRLIVGTRIAHFLHAARTFAETNDPTVFE